MIKFSLIIVNWNGRKWLKRNLDSFYAQTFRSYEVILVDNNSRDNSIKFVKKYYPWVKIIKTDNNGFGHAANIGAKNATGDYLMFFNEDMYVDCDFLQRYVRYIRSIKNKKTIGTVGCDIQNYDFCMVLDNKPQGFNIDLISTPMVTYNKRKLFHNTGSPMCTPRRLFLQAGGFCPNIFLYSEDIDYCWRVNIMGFCHYFIPDLHIYHYGGGVIGKFNDKKMSYYIRGEVNCILNNYSSAMLMIIIPYFLLYYLAITAFFLIQLKFKYIKMIWGTVYQVGIVDLKKILDFRFRAQSIRKVSDLEFIKQGKISIIPARIFNFFYHRRLVKKYGSTL